MILVLRFQHDKQFIWRRNKYPIGAFCSTRILRVWRFERNICNGNSLFRTWIHSTSFPYSIYWNRIAILGIYRNGNAVDYFLYWN